MTVRDRATVTVCKPVDGTRHRKASTRRARPSEVTVLKVDPRVMEAARAAIRPGQRLVIVSETEVHLVNQ